jgi:hypothetical protein
MYTTRLRAVADRARLEFFDAWDAACRLIDTVTEQAQAVFGDVADRGAYNNAVVRLIFALRQINGRAAFEPPRRVAWMRVWAAAQRDLAALHEIVKPDDDAIGSDGLTMPEVRRHAADLADALADADLASYHRALYPTAGIQRPPAPAHIECIAGDRLDHPSRIHNATFTDASVLQELMADLYPVCGRGVNALAALRNHPIMDS